MNNKTKKITILTTALAGSLLATSIGAVALSACGTTTAPAPSTPTEDPNKEFEGTSFKKQIDWTKKEEVEKLPQDNQGLIFADENRIEVIAIKPDSSQTDIIIPSSVRAITGYIDVNGQKQTKKGAFEGQETLTSVKFDGNTFTIGKQAFKGATGLKSISLPKSLNIIDNNAFEDCSNLEIFDLSNVKVIGNQAFKGAFPTTPTKDGETTETPVINSISLTKTITIGDNAFENANLKNIDFKGNTQLRSIGVAAFKGSKLTGDLDLSELTNLTEIENETFMGTSNLKKITLPESITVLGKSVFESTNAIEIDLSKTQITTIPKKTFYNASKLNNLTLKEEGIITFEDNSFQGTTNLESLTLPRSLKKLGFNVFNKDYIINAEGQELATSSGITSLDFSATQVTEIPHFAFAGMEHLDTVNLSTTTKALGAYMLYNSGVQRLELGANTALKEIPSFAFNSATLLEELKIDQATNLTTFKSKSFQNTPKLTTLKVPASLTTIEKDTFNAISDPNVSFLEETIKPENTAAGLVSLDLSKTTTAIQLPNNAFKGCKSLTTVTLHRDTTDIPDYAFANSGLERLSFGQTKKEGNESTPEQTAPKKLDFTNGTSVSVIGNNAFEGTNITEVDLKGATGLQSISTGVFKNIATLNKVELNVDVQSIHTGAFEGNIALSSVNFDKLTKLATIQSNNFNGTAFNSLALNKTILDKINESTFTGLTGSLTSVDLPITIKSVSENSLTKVSGDATNPTTSNLQINYKNTSGTDALPTVIDNIKDTDTDTSKIAILGYKNNSSVDLSYMSKLTTISGGTFSNSNVVSEIKLPAKATTFELKDASDLATAAFHENNGLDLLEYVNFGVSSNNLDNTELKGVQQAGYDNKIKNDKVLEIVAKLMNSVGRKDNLQESDISTDGSAKTWDDFKTTDTINFTADITKENLKEANKWKKGTTDTLEDGSIPTDLGIDGAGGSDQLGAALNDSNKNNIDIFFKHNNVVWKWNQEKNGNVFIVTLETVKGHSPMFYKSTTTSNRATTNNIALFGNNVSSSKKATNSLNAKEVKIKLNISLNAQ